MDLKFKKASQEDVLLIAQLADRIWKKHYISIISMKQIEFMLSTMYSEDSLRDQMQKGHQFELVYTNVTPIGYISITKKNDTEYFLNKFYVETSDQGKGVGSALLKHILNQIPDALSIELTVNRQNYKAINFYFKNGFIIKNVADFDIGNGYFMNDFIMIRKLK
jgi:ribosomal protein S18 acetylase RimI-like enzyme